MAADFVAAIARGFDTERALRRPTSMPLLTRELEVLSNKIPELRRFIEFLEREKYTADKLKQVARVAGSIDELFSTTGKISFFYGEALSRKSSPLAVLLSLFWLSCEVDKSAFEAHIPADQRDFLSSTGLVRAVRDDTKIKGQVTIVEFDSCYLLSDNLFYNHGGGLVTEDTPIEEDTPRAYPTMPMHASSIEIYRHRDPSAANSLLDIGCGSGVQSICGSSRYSHRTGIDNSARSIAFSKINAQLNGVAVDYQVADCLKFESRDKFDYILFNSPSFFEIEALGVNPERLPGAQCRSELAPRLIDERLEQLLSPTGLCQIWCVLYLPRALPTVREALEDSVPRLHRRFEITVTQLKDSPMALSAKAIATGKISGSSHLAFPSLEKLQERIRQNDVVEIAAAIVNVRLK